MNSGAARVYLARHGRTALNAEDRLRGLSSTWYFAANALASDGSILPT
jgi:broad specificity phosphatase PhoE